MVPLNVLSFRTRSFYKKTALQYVCLPMISEYSLQEKVLKGRLAENVCREDVKSGERRQLKIYIKQNKKFFFCNMPGCESYIIIFPPKTWKMHEVVESLRFSKKSSHFLRFLENQLFRAVLCPCFCVPNTCIRSFSSHLSSAFYLL